MPGSVGGGRSGGGGIGGGARGGFSGGSHGGFSSTSHRTFRSGVHRTGGGFHHMYSNGNDPEDEQGTNVARIIRILALLLVFGGPVISMVGNLFSKLDSPVVSTELWAEVDSAVVMEEDAPLFEIESDPRTRLDESLCKPVDVWYLDLAELFEQYGEGETVENALAYFYKQTGVQPFLVTTRYINGDSAPDWDTVENYLYDLYIELFGEDEGHYIFLYLEHSDSNYTLYYIPGLDAMTVVDDAASAILMDYVEWYYQVSSSYGELFAGAFTDTADTIMYVPEEYTSAVPAAPDAAELSTYPPADTVPAVEVDSSVDLSAPAVELTSEPDSVTAEDTSRYTEENTSEILWDDGVTEVPVEEHYVSADVLKYIVGGFVILLAVILFVVYILWDKKKMRDLEEDI